jgi:hypothetical protein
MGIQVYAEQLRPIKLFINNDARRHVGTLVSFPCRLI